ncbi:MAG: hypothetical protein V7744_20885 [Pseudomonadales bacterium]
MNKVNRKPYVQNQSRWWWLDNHYYFWYMVRECTSVPVAIYSVVLMVGILRLGQGEQAWNSWLDGMSSPLAISFHCLALVAAMYHAYTWFKLAPKIMVVRLGDWKLSEKSMLIGQWLGFVTCTATLITLAVSSGVPQ